MNRPTMLRTVNRILLALAGVLLIGAGVTALAAALDLRRRLGGPPPADWPWRDPGDVLLTRADRVQWRDDGWWWPMVIGGLVLLVLLALWWTLAQLRRDRLHELVIDSGEGMGALLRGRALEEALAEEAESLPGVTSARVTLTGRRAQPRLRVALLLEPQAGPAEAVRLLHEKPLAHARTSLGLDSLPAEVHLAASHHQPGRVD